MMFAGKEFSHEKNLHLVLISLCLRVSVVIFFGYQKSKANPTPQNDLRDEKYCEKSSSPLR